MLNPMAKESQPEVSMLSEVLETMEISNPLQSLPVVRQSISLFTGELALFLPVGLGGLGWSSRERFWLGHLIESWGSGFVIHLQVSLSDEEGEIFLRALGMDRVEDLVVHMEGDMEVVENKQ